MSGPEGPVPSFEPILLEDTLALAVAIADRTARGAEIQRSIISQLPGVPQIEKSPEELRAEQLGRTTLLLLQVENPSRLLTMADMVEATSGGDSGYERRAEELNERLVGASVSPDDVKSMSDWLRRELQTTSGITDERITEDFAKQLRASREVAAERGVDVTAVYADDEMYYEASRRTDPPEKAAADMKAMVESYSADVMNKMLIQMFDSILPAEVREMLGEEELTEMIMDSQIDPEVQAMVDAQVAVLQEGLRQPIFYIFVRTYGFDALNRLTPEVRDALLPKMPVAREIAELIAADPGAPSQETTS